MTAIKSLSRRFLILALVLSFAFFCVAQTNDTSSGPRGVLRLRARLKSGTGTATKGFARKRFYLVKGSLEQNKTLIGTIGRQPVITRDCYYRGSGASEQLINWLRENDCESVYCREIEQKDLEGPNAPPEFLAALAAGEKELGSRELARKWLTVYLPANLRDGFYKSRLSAIEAIIKQTETTAGARVLSVMTDLNGTAYFTNLEPGAYTLSNILPAEIEAAAAIWNCEVQVKPGDLATEKPYLISDRNEKNVKCVAVLTPQPVCDVMRRNDR